jgi:hypothetical protein
VRKKEPGLATAEIGGILFISDFDIALGITGSGLCVELPGIR